MLAETIAGLSLYLYKCSEYGIKEKVIDHPLYALIHDKPNHEITSFVSRKTLMTHFLLRGKAYAQIIRNGKYGSKFFINGVTQCGMLEHPNAINDLDRVCTSWNVAFGV